MQTDAGEPGMHQTLVPPLVTKPSLKSAYESKTYYARHARLDRQLVKSGDSEYIEIFLTFKIKEFICI